MNPWEQKYEDTPQPAPSPVSNGPAPWETNYSAQQQAPAAPQSPGFQDLMGSAIRKVPTGVMQAVSQPGEIGLLAEGVKEGLMAFQTPGFMRTGPAIAAGVAYPPSVFARYGAMAAPLISGYISGLAGYIGSKMAGDSEGQARQNAILSTQVARVPSGALVKEAGVSAAKNVGASISGEISRTLTDENRLPNKQEIQDATKQGLMATGLETGVNVATSQKVVDTVKSIERSVDEKRLKIFAKMRREGIVATPAQVRLEGGIGTTMAGGVGAMDKAASIKNRVHFNRMVREDLGVGGNGYIDDQLLDTVRRENYGPYALIKERAADAKKQLETLKNRTIRGSSEMERSIQEASIRKQMDKLETIAAADVEGLRVAREAKSNAYKGYKDGKLTREEYEKYVNRVDSLEAGIEAAAIAINKKSLPGQLKQSRRMIAKTWAAKDALSAGGYVDPQEFGKMLDNRIPLDGKMKDIGEFALEFGGSAVQASKVSVPTPGALGTMVAGQSLAYGNALPAVAAGAQIFGKNPLRSYLLSEYHQNKLAKSVLAPEYTRYYEGGRPAQIARYIGLQPTENK